MADPFDIFRRNKPAVQSTVVTGYTVPTETAVAAAHTHISEDVCPQCREKMQVAYGADNMRFYFCAQHGIAQPIPVTGAVS